MIDGRERLVRVEAGWVVLYRQIEFSFGAFEIALFEQIFSFVEMLLRLGLASADQRDCQQDRQDQRARDNCSHRNVPLRVRRNPDESASNGAELSRRGNNRLRGGRQG